MTRHKQTEHNHPQRTNHGVANRKISHSIVTVDVEGTTKDSSLPAANIHATNVQQPTTLCKMFLPRDLPMPCPTPTDVVSGQTLAAPHSAPLSPVTKSDMADTFWPSSYTNSSVYTNFHSTSFVGPPLLHWPFYPVATLDWHLPFVSFDQADVSYAPNTQSPICPVSPPLYLADGMSLGSCSDNWQ